MRPWEKQKSQLNYPNKEMKERNFSSAEKRGRTKSWSDVSIGIKSNKFREKKIPEGYLQSQ
jgi:hypothetical protein